MGDQSKGPGMDRRSFMGAVTTGAGAAAAAGLVGAPEANAAVPAVHFPRGAGQFGSSGTFRSESDIRDCDVDGQLPSDLNGAFYRVGPDAQYPKPNYLGDIGFDGEGHVSMFRFKDGHV